MDYWILFFVTLGNVAVRSFQQINVTHGLYARVVPTAAVFAWFSMLNIGYTAKVFLKGGSLFWMWTALATAGALGCLFSMKLSHKLRERYGK